jgi:HlyD family secretion protein
MTGNALGNAMNIAEPVTQLKRPVDGAMDRKVPKRRLTWPRIAIAVVGVALVGVTIQQVLRTSSVRSFAVAADLLTISTVQNGAFLDFIPVRGTVTPLNSVYLDAIEGGRVEAVLAEEGSFVVEGQPILELSNTTLQLDVISREAQVSEQLNSLRNTRLEMEQNRLALSNDLTEIDYQVTRLARLVDRRSDLVARNLIARQDFEESVDELDYYKSRREITVRSIEADERGRAEQIEQLQSSIEQLEQNLGIARSTLQSLIIKSPLSGQLTSLSAEIGQSKARGERLGQIDDVGEFKITAQVDEFYVTRLQDGQAAEFEFGGQDYELEVLKVYPEIRDGQFQMDMAFVGTPPPNLRRGQTLQSRVALGDVTQALLLPRGGFFEDTGGSWAFVLDASGNYAEKRQLTLGRRNPDYFEVLSGVAEGERVVTSEYSAFADMDRVELTK